MMSITLKGGLDKSLDFIQKLKLFYNGGSLGGVESLITRPAQTSHSGLTPQEREALGITDDLIRISVGIEDYNDLISDLQQALN